MCAKNGSLIECGKYESDMVGVGKSEVKNDPFVLLKQLDRWLCMLLYRKCTRREAL